MSKSAYINDTCFEMRPGETILAFVRRAKGDDCIPVICHADNLEPCGSCRLCTVEAAGKIDAPTRMLASCHTPVTHGMRIYPNSESVLRLRRNILELMLSDYPEESIAAGADQRPTLFQKILKDHDVTSSRFAQIANRKTHTDNRPDSGHPYIRSAFSECIYCYRCVRTCDELQGQFVFSVNGRGYNNRIIKGTDQTFSESECVSCGACVQNCPTNALYDRYGTKTARADRVVRTTCTYCGVGCNMMVSVRGNSIIGVEAAERSAVNPGHSCVKGRFAFEFYNHPDRLRSPLIKKDGVHVEATWDEAYAFIKQNLDRIKAEHGPDAIAGISSSRSTNEENFLMQKFMRAVIGTNNIDGCARVCHAPSAFGMQQVFGTGAATNSFSDLPFAELIMVVGSNPTEAHPVVGARIKQQILKGNKLIVIDPRKTELTRYADFHLQPLPGTNLPLFSLFAHYILRHGLIDREFIAKRTEGFAEFESYLNGINPDEIEKITTVKKELVEQAAILYAETDRALCVHGLGVTEHFQGSRSVMLLSCIAMMTGHIGRRGVGVNPLRGQNNVQGAADMGAQPHQGAGYLDITQKEHQAFYERHYGVPLPAKVGYRIPEMIYAAIMGELKALWIVGEDIMQTDPDTDNIRKGLENLEFLVVQELFMTETAKRAHVILPASCFYEKDGTFTSGERRVQRVNKVIEPLGNTRPDGQIIAEVMNVMGYPQAPYSGQGVLEEITRLVAPYRGITWENLGEMGKQWPVDEQGNETVILHDVVFKSGLGRFYSFRYQPSPELEHLANYPFILTTGRILEHYNCGSMTRRTPNVELVNEDLLMINPQDAERKGIRDGDAVEVSSPRGKTSLKARVTWDINPSVLHTTFHFPQVAINHLTGCVGDLDTMTPEFKVIVVDVKREPT
ncbi:MAG: formate dehydrogenase subunit alpha [Desulfuromonadaceae bacterium]|nr:formate dehydrogenase subunit alpha [Desulfuromonadaceae bacterium]